MTVTTAERRRSSRAAAAHPATISSRRGRFLARGRTANISENGAFVVSRCTRSKLRGETVILDVAVPTAAARGGRDERREVRYLCRIIRTENLGELLGIALAFVEKLA